MTVHTMLSACEQPECQRLYQFLVDDGIDVSQLGYEDLFYPLRCHPSLRLDLDNSPFAYDRLRWGSGDFIYSDQDERVEPFPIYERIQRGVVGFDVVEVDDG
jgi:hypothetical protein